MRAARKTIEEQYQLVLECRQSGMSDYLWCEEHGIKPGTFYSWIQNLRKAGSYDVPAPAGRGSYSPMPKQEVVRVDVVPESAVQITKPSTPSHIPGDSSYAMKLDLGRAAIHVANEVDPRLLAQTIQMILGVGKC